MRTFQTAAQCHARGASGIGRELILYDRPVRGLLLIPLLGGCGLLLNADPQLDGGVRDSATPDASPLDTSAGDSALPDASIPDVMLDATPRMCTGLCGDANQDGVLDASDVSRAMEYASGRVTPDECELGAADVLQTGAITEADSILVSKLAFGEVIGGCAPCPLICGDANADGMRDGSDAIHIFSFMDTRDFCAFWAADTDPDGAITTTDGGIVEAWLFSGGPEPLCAER